MLEVVAWFESHAVLVGTVIAGLGLVLSVGKIIATRRRRKEDETYAAVTHAVRVSRITLKITCLDERQTLIPITCAFQNATDSPVNDIRLLHPNKDFQPRLLAQVPRLEPGELKVLTVDIPRYGSPEALKHPVNFWDHVKVVRTADGVPHEGPLPTINESLLTIMAFHRRVQMQFWFEDLHWSWSEDKGHDLLGGATAEEARNLRRNLRRRRLPGRRYHQGGD